MKHFIILGFSFFYLTLVGCGKDKTDQEKCEEKEDTHVWVEAQKEGEEDKCITKEQKECEERGAEYVYDEENKTCQQAVSPQAACELKAGQGYKWENDQCVPQAKYTVLFKSSSAEDANHVVSVESGLGLRKLLQNVNECAVVTEAQVSNLKISAGDLSNLKTLCDQTARKCELKNYEVSYNSDKFSPAWGPGAGGPGPDGVTIGYQLKSAQSASENCSPLESTQ